jgi:hypothetical protein
MTQRLKQYHKNVAAVKGYYKDITKEFNGVGDKVAPPPRTKWTRRVPHPVLIGHAASPAR